MRKIDNRKILKILFIALFIAVFGIIFLIIFISSKENKLNPNIAYNIATFTTNNKENENVVSNNVQVENEDTVKVISKAIEIVKLNNGKWNYLDSSIGGNCELDGNDNIYETFTLTRNNNQVIRIVFTSDYEDEIVSGIKVGMDFKEIKKILGNPNFKNDKIDMIGYITDTLFLCIYKDEIAVYPNKFYINKDLEDKISQYYLNEFDGNKNDFLRYTQNNFEDFEFRISDDYKITIFSVIRGIKIVVDDSIDVTIYKNYDSSGNIASDIEEKIEYSNQYFIEIIEEERVRK